MSTAEDGPHSGANGQTNESNFPPPASNMIQVVDYDENFNLQLNDFLAGRGLTSLAFDYHVASILGAQSSGKSTLLNILFGTRFQTMNEDDGRYQVTQGVWLGLDSTSSTIVLDLEGTDSRERGEGAVNFERKIALFALALSEVLIVNLWAQDVGRYNAANMDLLKTVMELDLQLFFGSNSSSSSDENISSSKRMHKTRLLFVLRDHVASPIDKLCATLRSDVDNIWATIQKPEAARGIPVTDLFDIDFFAFPHKLLMQQEFEDRGSELRRRFRCGEVFDEAYQSGIAADGFSAYANNVWETIRANRELDIPSQKEMLAHVRCEQIAREAMDIFETAVLPARESLLNPSSPEEVQLFSGLVDVLKDAADASSEAYLKAACRYSKAIAKEKANTLNERTIVAAKELLDAQMHLASDTAIADVRNALDRRNSSDEPWKGWATERSDLSQKAQDSFDEACGNDAINALSDEHVLSFAKASVTTSRRRLVTTIESTMSKFNDDVGERARESVVDTFAKEVRPRVVAIFEADAGNVWEEITSKVSEAWGHAALSSRTIFSSDGIGLGDSESEGVNDVIETDVKSKCLHEARQAIHDAIGSPSTVLMRMTKRFDNAFRFDERGVPRHFGPREDIEALFVEARDNALSMLDALATIQLGGDVTKLRTADSAASRDLRSETLLKDTTREELRDQLKRQAGAVFMEAKRAQEAAKVTARIPAWLMLLLLFLGWNEFMAVLRSPVLLLLTVVVAPLIYVGYVLDAPTLLGPAITNTLQPYVEQAKATIRQLTEPAEPGAMPQPTAAAAGYSNSSVAHSAASSNSMNRSASERRATAGDSASASTAISDSSYGADDISATGSQVKDKDA